MGLFNTYNSVMQINKLVTQLEYQITANAEFIRRGNYTSKSLLEDGKRIENLLYEIADVLRNSSGARIASYKFRGTFMKIDTIIEFGLQVIKIIDSKI